MANNAGGILNVERIRTPMHRYGEADFDEDYLKWGFHDRKTQICEAESVLRIVGGAEPLRILDLACGTGVHAIYWAKQGHTVTGVDLSETFVAQARARMSVEGVTVEFIVSDIRDLLCRETYDVVTWIESSFLDDGIVGRAFHSLVDGGSLVLDVRNPDNAKTRRQENNWRTWREEDGLFYLERHETDEQTGARKDVWITIDPQRDSVHERTNVTARPMTVGHKAELLTNAGFESVELRTLDGTLFFAGPEPYWLWLVGKKPGTRQR